MKKKLRISNSVCLGPLLKRVDIMDWNFTQECWKFHFPLIKSLNKIPF